MLKSRETRRVGAASRNYTAPWPRRDLGAAAVGVLFDSRSESWP